MRQGCPLSSLLYILVVEVLPCNVRANPSICGLCLCGFSAALPGVSLYADDTSLLVCSDLFIREFVVGFLGWLHRPAGGH